MSRRSLVAGLAAALAAATTLPARPVAAWETTTHVGLAEQAGLAADVDGILRRLGWRGGMFEPLVIPPEDAATMMEALALHTASDGYVPDTRGQQYALGWLLAGAALADATPTWAANHFLDPATGQTETVPACEGRSCRTWARGLRRLCPQSSFAHESEHLPKKPRMIGV